MLCFVLSNVVVFQLLSNAAAALVVDALEPMDLSNQAEELEYHERCMVCGRSANRQLLQCMDCGALHCCGNEERCPNCEKALISEIEGACDIEV